MLGKGDRFDVDFEGACRRFLLQGDGAVGDRQFAASRLWLDKMDFALDAIPGLVVFFIQMSGDVDALSGAKVNIITGEVRGALFVLCGGLAVFGERFSLFIAFVSAVILVFTVVDVFLVVQIQPDGGVF